ncbi:MAG: hypothetical protein ABIS18_02835, partial [Actinomycetota bacterium]
MPLSRADHPPVTPSPRTYGTPNPPTSAPLTGSPSLDHNGAAPGKPLAGLDDLDAVGSAAFPILSPNGPFKEISLEVIYAEGHSPSNAAVSSLLATLRSVSGKRVIRGSDRAIPAKGAAYSVPEIQDISQGRTTKSIAPRVSILVIYLDSGLDEAPFTLGATVGATVMVVFPDKMKRLSEDVTAIETAASVHELGHILGLINYVITSPRVREDPEHLGHSTNKKSAMHWAIDSSHVTSEVGATPPTTFDADDLADL